VSDPLAPPSADKEAPQPIPELLRLGEHLAQAREQAGLSLEDLSRRLHLEPRQLKALEAGDHTLLPDGVFVVAMARRVAGALQTEVEEAIVAVRHSRLMRRPAPVRPPIPEAAGPLVSPPLLQSPTDNGDALPSAPTKLPFPWRSTVAAVLAACGLGAAVLLSQRSVPPTPSLSGPAKVESQPPARHTPAASPAPSRTSVAGDSTTLRLRATEPSWVEVRDAGGTTLFNGTLTGEKRFPLGRGLEVMAGRPYAVQAAIGSGQASPLGGVADIQWKRFNARGPQPQPEAPPLQAP
jgi:cytoskeleton protein RodZ